MIIAFHDNVFMMCEKKDFGVKFRIILQQFSEFPSGIRSEKKFRRRLRKPFWNERNHCASSSSRGYPRRKGIPLWTTEKKVLDCSVARVAQREFQNGRRTRGSESDSKRIVQDSTRYLSTFSFSLCFSRENSLVALAGFISHPVLRVVLLKTMNSANIVSSAITAQMKTT